MTDDELEQLNVLATGYNRQPTSTIEHRLQDIEDAIAGLMNATFEETDPDRKTRMAAVEMKLRLARERVLVKGRN